ncbi:MAG: LOG family protein [Desulfobacterales bacterium]|nr:LOG family protein [Desulfobacterales bacterium]
MSINYETDSQFRGLLQSKDGVIKKIIQSDENRIIFLASFGLSDLQIERLKIQPQDFIFSERSRIARLGVQITSEPFSSNNLDNKNIVLTLTASTVIPGYPAFSVLKDFFSPGFPVGRLVFCDPETLLTSEQVLSAIEKAEIKLPVSTSISSDGSILISPHKAICRLKEPLNKDTLGKILLREDGREILNLYQVREKVPSVIIPPNEGIITTCSMYLNEHYVVLQSDNNTNTLELGRHLPATILDPIKTRGIKIYLEIVNGNVHPIVNPLISAKIYYASKPKDSDKKTYKGFPSYTYNDMKSIETKLNENQNASCQFFNKPAAIIQDEENSKEKLKFFFADADEQCSHVDNGCYVDDSGFSVKNICQKAYAVFTVKKGINKPPASLILKYFPNILEHREIINLVYEGLVNSIYFFEPSREHGQFLSQLDHHRLQEYHAYGVDVYWISNLNNLIMLHTMRDGKGYFVVPERLADFHKSMLFAFYGSNKELSSEGSKNLGKLMDELINFWGRNIGIVTGGGSGVMELVNTLARERGILSGANFLEITDQSLTTQVDFCQVFQSSCRHSRQKWFEVASFPIFNVGGLGTLEELGIALCNMKLSILERVPVILFDTEYNGRFWSGMEKQIDEMVKSGRAPAWIKDYIIITDDPKIVIDAYRQKLHLF